MSAGVTPELLAGLWQERRPSGPPVAHMFRSAYADRWVRFHSLLGSKRYPESEVEYAIVLDRYNTVLDELFAGTDVFVVTMDWSNTPTRRTVRGHGRVRGDHGLVEHADRARRPPDTRDTTETAP
ncbi:hypothetical protein ACH492_06360 [Streptomyces sp. NPDC019443]|uniref:DUF3885 domain-containing protein n=1 Tax=Streptomyces sp. NPDC019443 TaxID=3365061 RepID=UPI00378AC886